MVVVNKGKLCLCLIIIIYCLILIGCEKNYYNEVWQIDSEEKFNEYFPKYTQFVIDTFEDYGMPFEYNINEDLSKEVNHRYITITVTLDNKSNLTFTFGNDDYKYGYFNFRGNIYIRQKEECLNIDDIIFEIIHKIFNFCSFDLRGNEYTYKYLMYEAFHNDLLYSSFIYHHDSLYDNIGYRFRLEEEDGIWRAIFRFESLLTDKNLF